MRSAKPPMQAPSAEVMSSWSCIADPEPQKGKLAPGWEVRQDPTTGAIYYYNPETGVMSKTRPEEATGSKAPLASGWEERIDPETGKVFYYNKESGIMSTEPP